MEKEKNDAKMLEKERKMNVRPGSGMWTRGAPFCWSKYSTSILFKASCKWKQASFYMVGNRWDLNKGK
jgi:hypothetical protein